MVIVRTPFFITPTVTVLEGIVLTRTTGTLIRMVEGRIRIFRQGLMAPASHGEACLPLGSQVDCCLARRRLLCFWHQYHFIESGTVCCWFWPSALALPQS